MKPLDLLFASVDQPFVNFAFETARKCTVNRNEDIFRLVLRLRIKKFQYLV